MKLSDLEATFVRRVDERTMREGVPLTDADGIRFLCPKCYAAKGGAVGTHFVLCWFAGRVPDSEKPGPGRWVPSGTGIEDLTFIGPAPQACSCKAAAAGTASCEMEMPREPRHAGGRHQGGAG
jgi:hypothetical protein